MLSRTVKTKIGKMFVDWKKKKDRDYFYVDELEEEIKKLGYKKISSLIVQMQIEDIIDAPTKVGKGNRKAFYILLSDPTIKKIWETSMSKELGKIVVKIDISGAFEGSSRTPSVDDITVDIDPLPKGINKEGKTFLKQFEDLHGYEYISKELASLLERSNIDGFIINTNIYLGGGESKEGTKRITKKKMIYLIEDDTIDTFLYNVGM